MKGRVAVEGALQRLKLRSGILVAKEEVSASRNERVENKDSSLDPPPVGWGNWSNWGNQWGNPSVQ